MNWSNEAEARKQIKDMVAQYYRDFKEKKEKFKPGDRITYASRVFDEKEMQALTDATLDFWLTTGRFSNQFEKDFASWIGVKYAHLVNSGSSANLIAFMVLTAPELEKHHWNLDMAIEKVVEWSKCWVEGGDVRVCMDKEIEEFLGVEK